LARFHAGNTGLIALLLALAVNAIIAALLFTRWADRGARILAGVPANQVTVTFRQAPDMEASSLALPTCAAAPVTTLEHRFTFYWTDDGVSILKAEYLHLVPTGKLFSDFLLTVNGASN
jgi:hypothetical protein